MYSYALTVCFEAVVCACAQTTSEFGSVRLSLSRLNHLLPRDKAHPEVMQATAEFHHQIADAAFPKADPVFGDAASFDAAVDVLDPEPAIMQSLIFSLLLRCQLPAAGFLQGHQDLHFRQRERDEAEVL